MDPVLTDDEWIALDSTLYFEFHIQVPDTLTVPEGISLFIFPFISSEINAQVSNSYLEVVFGGTVAQETGNYVFEQ